MIDLKNYEEYIMLYVDDELPTAETKELMDFLEKHPDLKKELEAYQKTKLPMAAELVFADKNKLIKQQVRRINLNRWLVYGAAASVVLLIGLATIKWMNNPDDHIPNSELEVANNRTEIPDSKPQIPNAQLAQKTPAVTPSTREEEQDEVKKSNPKSKIQNPNTQVAKSKVQPINQPTNQPAPQNPIIIENKEPQIAEAKEEPNEKVEPILNKNSDPKIAKAEEKPQKKKRGLLAMLPFSSEKKQGFNHLKNNVEGKVETVKNINEAIKNTSFEVKLGNKELLVINL